MEIEKEVKKKILIIEDEEMLLSTLIENLRKEGFDVFGVTNALEAFEWLKVEKPDLILTDLIMSHTDGFEVINTLKQNVHLANVPIVVLSNQSEEEDIEKAKELGVVNFLVKAELSLGNITEEVKKFFN